MSNAPRFLERTHATADAQAVRALYAGWAPSYDAEMAAMGYAAPARCAEALLDCGADLAAPLLDLGCGTGLSGAAFRAAGFYRVDGHDVSAEMQSLARAKPGVYRDLVLADLERPIPVQTGEYASIAMVGVLGCGHAPAAVIDDVLARLAPGGLLVFSLDARTLADPACEAQVASACDSGSADAVFSEVGPYLPGAGMRAKIIVLRRR